MLHTAEIVSVVCCTLFRLFPWCAAHCWDCLFGMLHTAEIISAVCCTPPRLTLQCATHRADRLCGVFHTAEIDSAVCSIQLRWSPWCAICHGDDLRGVQHTAEITLWSNISTKSNWIWKYFSLFIRGPNGFESLKNWSSKISWHTPFNKLISLSKKKFFYNLQNLSLTQCNQGQVIINLPT